MNKVIVKNGNRPRRRLGEMTSAGSVAGVNMGLGAGDPAASIYYNLTKPKQTSDTSRSKKRKKKNNESADSLIRRVPLLNVKNEEDES